ncbi:MAG TPA: hypothetical protein VHT70_04050 [Candidatus Saccharimonadales bacterium]|jgi:lysylphosphatidylglycerol synthetase-like protein (DUF2156 family)|nr:hypothetical protein [Candidatus Saccharimonadales bacterium]
MDTVNVHFYDLLECLQGLQIVLILLGVLIVGYVLMCRRTFTRELKLLLWALAVAWLVASAVLYVHGLHNYLTAERPLYQQQNFSKTGLK